MPKAHTRFSYTFAELSDDAKTKAVETVAGNLGGEWWDTDDIDRVSETIMWELGRTLKAPGWDTEGSGDFRGIHGVKSDGWDLDRGSHVLLRGSLDRDNAPGLAWTDGVGTVTLTPTRYGTTVDVEPADVEFICTQCGQDSVWEAWADSSNGPAAGKHHVIHVSGGTADDDVSDADHTPFTTLEGLPDREARCDAMKAAVKAAMDLALKAGREEMEYIGSQDNAREYIENNQPDFNEDGTLF